jgi:hypothetical protein
VLPGTIRNAYQVQAFDGFVVSQVTELHGVPLNAAAGDVSESRMSGAVQAKAPAAPARLISARRSMCRDGAM